MDIDELEEIIKQILDNNLMFDFHERLKERLDVMTVQGDGASFKALHNAGVKKADLIIAASGSDASNVLACQIARHFGVKKTG